MKRICFACEELAACIRFVGIWLCGECRKRYYKHMTGEDKHERSFRRPSA